MDKHGVEDKNLSRKAKWILAYLMSKYNNWKTVDAHLVKQSSDGLISTRSGLKELSDFGYRIKVRVVSDIGKLLRWETFIFEKPVVIESDKTQNVGNIQSGKPTFLTIKENELEERITSIGIAFARIESEKVEKRKSDKTHIVGFPHSGKSQANNNKSNKIKKENKNNDTAVEEVEATPVKFSLEQAVALFDKFWDIYPRKEKRLQAQMGYVTVLQNWINAEDIIAGLRDYVAHWDKEKTEMKFIPLASNFLSERRWTDWIGGNGAGATVQKSEWRKSLAEQEREELEKYG